jgi:CBS domain-containing protein
MPAAWLVLAAYAEYWRREVSVLVADVMTPASVTDTPNETVRASASRMWEQQTGSLLVMDGERLAGIFTERDVVRAVAQGIDLDATPVGAVMSRDVVTTAPHTPLDEAARIMASRWIRHLPVVEEDRVVGVVSLRALAAALATLGRLGAHPAGHGHRTGHVDQDRRLDPGDAGARRAAELVGPLLPEVSADETDLGWGDWYLDDSNSDRIRTEVPPHHLG